MAEQALRWRVNDQNDSRMQGVDFGDLDDDLEDESYPLGKAEVLDRYGERELGLEQDEETTVRSVLEPQGDVTYHSAEDVERSILNMVGEDAVGREEYSDRGDPAQEDAEDESI